MLTGKHLFAVDEVPRDGEFTLDGEAGRHAARVVRVRSGEEITVTDGVGSWALLKVESVQKNSVATRVLRQHVEDAPQPRLTVVQALPKHERAQITVDLLTELGVDEIVPWAASRSIGKWSGARGEKALSKWRATARAASLQSRRVRFPDVTELASTQQVARRIRSTERSLLLHETASEPLAGAVPRGSREILLIVGPEGSLTPEEVELFAGAGARRVALGPTVLRTSTAGAAALAVVNSACGRW